jgi:hypothetical protein
MYLEARETARLYRLLTEKLGNDTTEAMFKYIDNKTERSVEATIKTLATKNDLAALRNDTKDDLSNFRKEIGDEFTNLRKEIADGTINLRKEMGELKYDLSNKINNSVKWMFVFWVGQFGATMAILLLILKK